MRFASRFAPRLNKHRRGGAECPDGLSRAVLCVSIQYLGRAGEHTSNWSCSLINVLCSRCR